MKQLRVRLENSIDGLPSLPTIWFDAWKYDRIDDTRSALIYRIMLDMRERSEGELKGKITQVLKDSSHLLLAFASGTRLTVGFPGVSAQFPSPDQITSEAESFQTEVDQFSEKFAQLVKEFVGTAGAGDNGKLVIFIASPPQQIHRIKPCQPGPPVPQFVAEKTPRLLGSHRKKFARAVAVA